jgi:hypothetical protein
VNYSYSQRNQPAVPFCMHSAPATVVSPPYSSCNHHAAGMIIRNPPSARASPAIPDSRLVTACLAQSSSRFLLCGEADVGGPELMGTLIDCGSADRASGFPDCQAPLDQE